MKDNEQKDLINLLDNVLSCFVYGKLNSEDNSGFKIEQIFDICKINSTTSLQSEIKSILLSDGYIEPLTNLPFVFKATDLAVSFCRNGEYRQHQINFLEKALADAKEKRLNRRISVWNIIISILSFISGLLIGLLSK